MFCLLTEYIVDGECFDEDNLAIIFNQRHCVYSTIGCSIICIGSSYTRDWICRLIIWQIIPLRKDTRDNIQLWTFIKESISFYRGVLEVDICVIFATKATFWFVLLVFRKSCVYWLLSQYLLGLAYRYVKKFDHPVRYYSQPLHAISFGRCFRTKMTYSLSLSNNDKLPDAFIFAEMTCKE